ncbi:MAG: ABC transporter ATP-binding protein [Planctomycetaceae bacterium]|jgi:lipoprotein-releasing system ATP-binding protein|nr:ABC transporter ATP-binding protein [Planctomycetaceae bacterium]
MPELQVEHLHKEYPVSGAGSLVVLDDCSFSLSGKESLAVTGPSGSGKSTLLNILGTIERPDSGRFSLDGFTPSDSGTLELAKFRRLKLGFIFQDHHLLPQCSALENVLIPILAGGAVSEKNVQRADWLLERVGLQDRKHHRPSELSGGERQRVAIARALINQPALILADEPTGNLDRKTADSVIQLILELQTESGSLLVLVTHDPLIAQRLHRQHAASPPT